MKLPNNKTIADCWLPTYENVSREFVIDNLEKLLFSDELPNFRFDFREKEAIEFIENIIKEYVDGFKNTDYKEKIEQKYDKILEKIKQKTEGNTQEPVMVVSDHKKFFEYLRQVYEKDIELFFQRTDFSGFNRYEKNNFFELIWLRATPNDFNNPEEFLKKQAEMIQDTTFEKYDEETYLGKLECLNNHIICIKNGMARTCDENFRQIEITIYDKEHYNNKELFNRPHYTLPVIRYGIYEKDNRKICSIGSIQDKSYEIGNEKNIKKKMDREKYRVNKDISKEDTSKVEPKNVIALSIFINLLHREGITDIEVPSMYVLDHEYHRKRNKYLLRKFKQEWTKDLWGREKREKYPEDYKKAFQLFLKTFRKQDLISEIKTERLLLTARRLLNHYPKANIIAYPEEMDNYMHLQIPVVNDENDINGDILKEFYNLVQTLDIEKQNDTSLQEAPVVTHDNEVDSKWIEEFLSL